MITSLELSLLLRSDDQAEAVQDLVERGLSRFIVDHGAVVGMRNTPKGAAKLNGTLLPPTTE
jgi:hypothetical protein